MIFKQMKNQLFSLYLHACYFRHSVKNPKVEVCVVCCGHCDRKYDCEEDKIIQYNTIQ